VTNAIKGFAPWDAGGGGGGALACCLLARLPFCPVNCCPGPRKLGMWISAKARVAAWPRTLSTAAAAETRLAHGSLSRPMDIVDPACYRAHHTRSPSTTSLTVFRLSRPWVKRPALRFRRRPLSFALLCNRQPMQVAAEQLHPTNHPHSRPCWEATTRPVPSYNLPNTQLILLRPASPWVCRVKSRRPRPVFRHLAYPHYSCAL
jgi:hypothetical protein